jgi:hypothetical protein
MARYSNFLHRKVEVLYRAGDIILPASGVFVADSGRSIFLEQHFEQRGQTRNFRWEIPYQYVVRLKDSAENSSAPAQESAAPAEIQVNDVPERVSQNDPKKSRARAASALGGAASFLNPTNRPKTV